jgi:hypothetical protein
MLAKILVITGLVATGLLFILVTSVSPSDAGAFGILGVFLLSYISLLCATSFAVYFMGRIIHGVTARLSPRVGNAHLTLKKSYYYSTVIAVAPVIILSLQSVSGVSAYEIALVILFVVLGCIYIAKRTA